MLSIFPTCIFSWIYSIHKSLQMTWNLRSITSVTWNLDSSAPKYRSFWQLANSAAISCFSVTYSYFMWIYSVQWKPEILSFWHHFRHWVYRKLSFRIYIWFSLETESLPWCQLFWRWWQNRRHDDSRFSIWHILHAVVLTIIGRLQKSSSIPLSIHCCVSFH